MPMERASTRTVGNLVLLSSRAKIKGRKMLGMAVSTLFPHDQNTLGVRVSVSLKVAASALLFPIVLRYVGHFFCFY